MATHSLRFIVHAALIVSYSLALPALAAQSGAPPVSITKTVSPNPVRAGENVTWTLRIFNSSPDAIANVRIADVLPDSITEIAASGPGFDCTVSGVRVGCLAAELPSGASLVSITGRAQSPTAPVSSGPSIAARGATVTARNHVPDGIMDTVANLKLTIDALEKEKEGLNTELSAMAAKNDQSHKQVIALSAELETARVSGGDAVASLRSVREESKVLQSAAATAQAERDRTAAELKTSADALAAAQSELASTKQTLDSKQRELDQVAMELATVRGSLVMAEPLSFAVDCPVEATTQKWLLNNLPFLLEDAIANPTPSNARAFLCAQREATSHDGVRLSRLDRSNAPATARIDAPAPITDGKLHTHYRFTKAPTDEEVSKLRAAAENGSVEALNDWGVLVLMGVGTPQNEDLGLRYINKAADAGSALAAGNLAVVFELGVGVDPNRATASQWRRVAAANSRG